MAPTKEEVLARNEELEAELSAIYDRLGEVLGIEDDLDEAESED
jgi:hypothetical protein